MAQTYLNADGLFRRYGTEEAKVKWVGEVSTADGRRMTQVGILLTDLSASAQTILSDTVIFPTGARIEEVEVIVDTVTAGTNSNLDLGFIKTDRSTELDYNGLIAAGDDWHTSAVGTKTTYNVGSTEAGAVIGTTLTANGLLVAKADTAAFTAGELLVRVYWYMPPTVTTIA